MEIINVVVIRDNVIHESFSFTDIGHAEKKFLDLCAENMSNWDEHTSDDMNAYLDDGYANFGQGTICIFHSFVN